MRGEGGECSALPDAAVHEFEVVIHALLRGKGDRVGRDSAAQSGGCVLTKTFWQ
jgi:hypothetical protein